MTDEQIKPSNEIKFKQYRNFVIIAGIAVVIASLVYYLMDDGSTVNKDKNKLEAGAFTSPIDHIDTQSIWLERAQNQLKEQQKQTTELKQQLSDLQSKENDKSLDSDPKYVALLQQVQTLQKALEDKPENSQNNAIQIQAKNSNGYSDGTLNELQADVASIDNDVLNLKENTAKEPKKNINTYVPAGTFAEAITLGAADASAGVQAQSNPSPMLFRIVADGTLPNKKKSHLKDCVLTSAVKGDISSERGEARLERISCVFPNGEIVEQLVEGTIFGKDAKNGIRGNPVWREGALLGRAAIAGTLSGLGSAVSQGYTTNSISPLGSTQTVNNGEILKYGVAQGASTAMEKLADYNIRRAEQYHPTIQITAGQSVDVVFLKGFFLDGRSPQESSDTTNQQPHQLFNNPSSTEDKSTNTSSSGLTLSESEMQKIKDHEATMGWYQHNTSENPNE